MIYNYTYAKVHRNEKVRTEPKKSIRAGGKPVTTREPKLRLSTIKLMFSNTATQITATAVAT